MPTIMRRRRSPSVIHPERIPAANAVLQCFAAGTTIEVPRGRIIVCWTSHGTTVRKYWATRGQDFWPVWHNQWGQGGTCCRALSQLVRWIQGRPIWPLRMWRYWTSERVFLGQERGSEMVAALEKAGYPESTACVLCGRDLASAYIDWWSLDGVSGPCCVHTDEAGCRQRVQDDR